MDGGAWQGTVHGVAKSRTRLSNWSDSPKSFLGSVVKNLLAMQEMQELQVQSLGQEDPLEEGMATHSSVLAWRIPWTEEPGRLQSTGSQRVRHDWIDLAQALVIRRLSWIIPVGPIRDPQEERTQTQRRGGAVWPRRQREIWRCSILKEISPEDSLEGLMLKLKLQYFGHLTQRPIYWKRLWSWERLRAAGEGDNRGWDDWMASSAQWTWVWANSRR